MDLWRKMSQDLNYNVMFSPRGIINLAHSDAQMNVYARRGNSMRLNGIDAVLLNREASKRNYSNGRLFRKCKISNIWRINATKCWNSKT